MAITQCYSSALFVPLDVRCPCDVSSCQQPLLMEARPGDKRHYSSDDILMINSRVQNDQQSCAKLCQLVVVDK